MNRGQELNSALSPLPVIPAFAGMKDLESVWSKDLIQI